MLCMPKLQVNTDVEAPLPATALARGCDAGAFILRLIFRSPEPDTGDTPAQEKTVAEVAPPTAALAQACEVGWHTAPRNVF